MFVLVTVRNIKKCWHRKLHATILFFYLLLLESDVLLSCAQILTFTCSPVLDSVLSGQDVVEDSSEYQRPLLDNLCILPVSSGVDRWHRPLLDRTRPFIVVGRQRRDLMEALQVRCMTMMMACC